MDQEQKREFGCIGYRLHASTHCGGSQALSTTWECEALSTINT